MTDDTKSELVIATLMFAVALCLGFLAIQIADEAPVIAGAVSLVGGCIAAASIRRAWRCR